MIFCHSLKAGEIVNNQLITSKGDELSISSVEANKEHFPGYFNFQFLGKKSKSQSYMYVI